MTQSDSSLEELFGRDGSSKGYSELKRKASNVPIAQPSREQVRIEKAVGRMLHLNDVERIREVKAVLKGKHKTHIVYAQYMPCSAHQKMR